MLNSVRLSLLLACTAVCTAPGLLPVAGFPQMAAWHGGTGFFLTFIPLLAQVGMGWAEAPIAMR